MTQQVNDLLVLISGGSATGKSASLQDLENQEGVVYANCESGKKLPFKNDFAEFKIIDPYQVLELFDYLHESDYVFKHPRTKEEVKARCIVTDTLTFLMDMFESQHVLGSEDTMRGWSNYQQFFKTLMQERVARCKVPVIFTAHTLTIYNEGDMVMETKVPIKGALKNNGIESYFSCVVSTKKVPIKVLEGYKNDMLEITEEEKMLGYKHVFQTRLTKETVNERIRSPMGMFSQQETYIDNNAQKLLNHLRNYYSHD